MPITASSIIGLLSVLMLMMIFISIKKVATRNILLISILYFVLILNIITTNSIVLGILVLIFGLSYISIKEVRHIEITIPEYILLPITLGMSTYRYLGEIHNANLIYNVVIPIIELIFAAGFLLAFVINYQKIDPDIIHPINRGFWILYPIMLIGFIMLFCYNILVQFGLIIDFIPTISYILIFISSILIYLRLNKEKERK